MPSADELFTQTCLLMDAGQLAPAAQMLRQLIALQPHHAPALHRLGMIAYHTGPAAQALDWFRRAVDLQPADPCYLTCLGAAYQALGHLDEAARWHRRALQYRPDDPMALNNLGITLAAQGQAEEAAGLFRRALQAEPGDADALCNLGAALRALGQLDEAAACYRDALRLRPEFPQAHLNLGNLLREKGRLDDAEACYRAAVTRWPQFGLVYRNWGQLAQRRGRPEQAVGLYRQALQHQPGDVLGHLSLAEVLLSLNQAGEAVASCRRALQLNPTSAEAHTMLGNAYHTLGELDPALASYDEALRLRPDYATALYNRGLTVQAQGRLPEAQACLRQALEREPGNPVTHSTFLASLLYDPDVEAGTLYAEHRRWGERHADPLPRRPPARRGKEPGGRLRVGYVSPDFRNHAVASFLEPVLRHHDRRRVEVYGYAEVAAPDETTARLQGLADHWRSTLGRTDDEVADQVERDQIDVLIDLAGHTAGNRLLVFARRPAPVQLSWLGYPCGAGLAAIPYRLADAVTDPEGEPGAPGEVVVRLPDCFCCYGPPEQVPLSPGLPEERAGVVTFGSLHKLEKLNDAVLDLWARVLREVPRARLLLCRHTLRGPTAERLRERLAQRGLGAGRVVAERVEPVGRQHLRVYDRVDVLLDTFPWSGHTTACEALAMGVPVVTLRGRHPAGRLTASVLTAAGLTDLVGATPEEYVRIAVRLAEGRDRRGELRGSLRQRLLASPLCQAEPFTRELEECLRRLCGGPKTDKPASVYP